MKYYIPFLLPLLLFFCASSHAQQSLEVWNLNTADNSNKPGFVPSMFYKANGKLFFSSNSGVNSLTGLWVSNGTKAGTEKIRSFPGLSSISHGIAYNSKLYFTARSRTNPVDVYAFWSTDGTLTNTVIEVDSIRMQHPIIALGKIFFWARGNGVMSASAPNQTALYLSDGTKAGTKCLAFFQGDDIDITIPLKEYNGRVYFQGHDENNGVELWSTDGTTEGTLIVKNICTSGHANPKEFTVFNNRLYFTANHTGSNDNCLFSTDGTDAGTLKAQGTTYGFDYQPTELTTFNNRLYFVGSDSSNMSNQLYATDGTPAGIYTVNQNHSKVYNVHTLKAAGNHLYFSGFDDDYGEELWQYNGDSTTRITDLLPGEQSSYAHPVMAYGDHAIFSAIQKVIMPDEIEKRKFYLTNGISFIEIAPPADTTFEASEAESYENSDITLFQGSVYFRGFTDSIDSELWKFTDTALASQIPDIVNAPIKTVLDFQLYPNPGKREFTIQLPAVSHVAVQIIISDITGKKIHSQIIPPGVTTYNVILSNKEVGIYIATVNSPSGYGSKLFVVEGYQQ